MRCTTGKALLIGVALGILLRPQPLPAQACKDEESMADYYKKDLAGLVGTVKKESLEDFQKAYHQKSSLTKLTLYGSNVEGVLTCLDKAAQDPTATREQVDAYKAKRETYSKLKERIQHDRNALKGTEAPKDAKALIEKIDLTG
jgi:hypothetical protein